MIKAIFRLTDVERKKIFRLREMGVRPPDIARRFGLSEGVVHKIVQAQRAMHAAAAKTKMGPQRGVATEDLSKQEAS
jgi:DNA-directed RNA polymerase specialized sigma24 family protein